MAGSLTPIYGGMSILSLVSGWIVFTKAGRPGWAIIIPFYNLYILLTVAGKPGWWLILLFIPVVNIVISIITSLGLAEKFGKGTGFAIGLVFLPIIFLPILAFSDAQYIG
ncbi:MAG: DUF5684 domain-containing protein [Planctomycetota bacterium]|nr:DUF5684 domain-containing protein [Planctomycetota bacterium]